MSPFPLSQPFHLLIFSSLLLLLVFHNPTANAQDLEDQEPINVTCHYTTGNYTRDSTFAANVNELLTNLSSSSNLDQNRGFYNNTIGKDSNTVYGQILCRGDSNSTKCHDCINKASTTIKSSCKTKTADIWYDTCQLRYSDTNFFGKSANPWVFYHRSKTKIPPTDLGSFKENLGKLMYELARAIKAKPWLRNFATGDTNYADLMMVYGLVQCVPDISPSDCYTCLADAIRQNIRACCVDRIGGRVIGHVCGLRFENTHQFYNESKVADPAPGSGVNRVLILVPAFTGAIILALMAALVYFGDYCKWWSKRGEQQNKTGNLILILVPAISGAVILCLIVALLRIKKTHLKKKKNVAATGQVIEGSTIEFLQIGFKMIRVATDDFSDENKLGQGGFGLVYKGTLQDGREIAVKRLSINSGQGAEQFRNEVALVAKLQHRNFVRIYGCCVEGEEKLLIYEYIPNKRLDNFLFDPVKRLSLNWQCRLKIIGGIARGLLYPHEDSRLKIIHRDLKAGNILIDAEMNPKISDFGMAKIFGVDQTQGNTNRIAGTLYAWNNGTVLEIIDSSLSGHCSTSKVMRCIHIGLLCVQDDPIARPTMSSVVVMLTSFSVTLLAPSAPAFFINTGTGFLLEHSSQENNSSQRGLLNVSANDVLITELEPR